MTITNAEVYRHYWTTFNKYNKRNKPVQLEFNFDETIEDKAEFDVLKDMEDSNENK